MKKIVSVLLLVVLVLAGCGSSTATGEIATELVEPVTIELWHPFSGDVEASLQSITDDFNEQNDMVTVELQSQGVYSDLLTKLTAAQGSDSLPVMSFAYSSWDGLWSNFEDISEYGEKTGIDMNFANIVPAFLDEVSGANGEIYGLPYNKSTDILFYNKDLVKEAGIDQVPTTAKELLDDAKQITEKTNVVGLGYDSLQNYLATAMISEGVTWVNDSGEFQFTNEKIEADVQAYKDAIDAGYMRTRGEDGYFSDIFGAEKVAAYIGSSAGATYIDSAVDGKFEWGALPLSFPRVPQQGTNIVIYNTATAEEKLAAWEYLNFLYEDANIVNFSLATGYMPATLSSIDTEEYQKAIKDNEVVKATVDSIDKMQVTVPTFAGAGEIFSTNIATAMSSILDNGEEVNEALSTLNEEAKAVYDRNN